MNSKGIVITLMGASMWLASSSSVALINDECSADTEHADVVCPYIGIVREQLREVAMPTTPDLEALMGEFSLQGTSVNENAAPSDEGFEPDTGIDSLL